MAMGSAGLGEFSNQSSNWFARRELWPLQMDLALTGLTGHTGEVKENQISDAVLPPGPLDAGVAWHYGQPFAEQRALQGEKTLVDLSHLGVLRISGPDRLSWLQDLTTADVRDLAPGAGRLALILDHNGRVEHELHIVDDGEGTWLIVEPESVESLVAYLDSMRFLLRVEVNDRSQDVAVIGATTDVQLDVGLACWRVPPEFSGSGETPAGVDAGGGAAKYVPDRPELYSISEWLIPRSDLAAVLASAHSLAGTWALSALRVAAGVPRVIVDGDAKVLPHELGLIGPAVHLDKGCYRGQESVARTHNMGRPPRRLTQLLLQDSDDLPEPGTDVFLAGRRVGQVGSVVQHVELGPIALALLKRNVDPDAVLQVGSHEASQILVVVPG